MDDTLLLDSPWPDDLDPATVPFLARSVTVLRRAGFFDDWTRFSTLTETEVLSWWNAGVGTVADIRTTGNAAIVNYHGASLTGEPWAAQIWDRDPRFKEYLPKGGGTVRGIVACGSHSSILTMTQTAMRLPSGNSSGSRPAIGE